MSDLLRDYERKRAWAVQHLDVLRESVERFTNVDRESVLGEFDTDGSKYVFHIPLEPLAPDWALLVGDFVYGSRASLDYLITALIRSTGKKEHNSSEFPLQGGSRTDWLKAEQRWEADARGKIKQKLSGTPPGTKAALKHLQPFYGVPALDPYRHPLFILRELSNRDKHRRLNLLVRNAAISFVDASGEPLYGGPAPATPISEAYEGNTYTVTFTVHDKPDVDVYLLPTYDIRLHEPPSVFGNLLETLTGINEYIDSRVLPAVRTLLP